MEKSVGTIGHTSHRSRGLLAMALGALGGSLAGLQSIAQTPAPRRHGRSAIRSYAGWHSKSRTPSYKGQTEADRFDALAKAEAKRARKAAKLTRDTEHSQELNYYTAPWY